jgi:capsular polysaccharide transport system permease protein
VSVQSAPAPAPLWRGLAVQAHVIGALILRELHTRYGRENIGYLWVIGEPLILAAAVAALHAGAKTHYGLNLRPVPFSIVGYCVFILFRSIILRAETTLLSNQPLLYHRMVGIFDMLVARAALEGAATVCALAILLAGACALGLAEPPAQLLLLIAAIALMLWFAFGLSLLVCAATHVSPLAARLIHPITYLLMPLSGAFYMLSWIPQPFRGWLAWFPLTQIFELARAGQFASAKTTYVDAPYLVAWCLALSFFGLAAIRITRRRIHL